MIKWTDRHVMHTSSFLVSSTNRVQNASKLVSLQVKYMNYKKYFAFSYCDLIFVARLSNFVHYLVQVIQRVIHRPVRVLGCQNL